MQVLTLKAPAKINLFLEVTRKRPDGYHDLVTLFARVGLCDTLTIRRTAAPGIRLSLSNQSNLLLSSVSDNIVYKAAEKFFRAFEIVPAVSIRLVKRIPVGAGLGGGSSDAASALKGLARLYGRNTAADRRKLARLALELGSDVPFFLTESAFAVGRGRGEKLSPAPAAGRLPAVLLVYPGEPVYTGGVYRSLKLAGKAEVGRKLKDLGRLLAILKGGGLGGKETAGLLFNRLEEPVLPVHRKVSAVRRELSAQGGPVMMSGSGAVVFALARSGAEARRMASLLRHGAGRRFFIVNFC